MSGDKSEPGPQDKGLCMTLALRVSDSSQYWLQPLALSIFSFQLDSAAAWLEQRREIVCVSGWGDMNCCGGVFKMIKGWNTKRWAKEIDLIPALKITASSVNLRKLMLMSSRSEWDDVKLLALSSTPEIHNIPVHPRFVADKMWCEALLDV